MKMKKIILLFVLLCLLCGCAGKKEELSEEVQEEETVEEVKELPFAEANELKISDADGVYDYPIYPYIMNLDLETIEVPEIETEATPETIHFHDLKVEETDDGYLYSFAWDNECTLTTRAKPTSYQWYYTFSAITPAIFDYYTGNVFKDNKISVDGLTTFLEGKPADIGEDDFAYSEVSWDGQTYKVGIYEETYYGSDPDPKVKEDGWTIYKDNIVTQNKAYIKTDKEFDGLMIAVLKSGMDKERHQKKKAYFDHYEQLKKEAEETGEKSEELLRYEEKKERMLNVFESSYDDDLHYDKDDFYFIKVSDIPKGEDQTEN